MKTGIIVPILMSSLTLTIVRNEDICPYDCTNCQKCPPGYYLDRNKKICYGCVDGYSSLCDESDRCEICDTCPGDMVRTECSSEHNVICGCQEGYVEDIVQGRCVPESAPAQTTMWTTTEPSTTTRNEDSVTSQPADDSTPRTTERDRNGNGESTTFQPADDSTPRTTERDGKESWLADVVTPLSTLVFLFFVVATVVFLRKRTNFLNRHN